jgi:hypothetical protein
VTFDGWLSGRGNPAPRSTDGRFAFFGNLPTNWSNRFICGLGLAGHIEQVGIRGAGTLEYVDQIGDATLGVTLDRVYRYLDRGAGTNDWYDISWRRLTIEYQGNGRFNLIVQYETGVSDQDETEN